MAAEEALAIRGFVVGKMKTPLIALSGARRPGRN